MEFKYLKVVDSKPVVGPKPMFTVVETPYKDTQLDLILPLHGTDPFDASQQYLYANKSKQAVYVREYLPETRYEQYVDELYNKIARHQLVIFQKEEADRLSKQKLDSILKEF